MVTMALYGRTMLNSFWDGSSWYWLVGHWHGRLGGTLSEQAPVGSPVFALDGWNGGAAERKGQGAARTLGQRPAHPMSLIREEGAHRQARARVVSHSLPLLAGRHAADVQGRDLDRWCGDLLVCHVLVHKTVHTPMHLFQVHLLVLERVREERRDREAEICWFQDAFLFVLLLSSMQVRLTSVTAGCVAGVFIKTANWKV